MTAGRRTLSRDQARAIAQEDATRAYGDLSHYRVHIALETDGWHVDYELKGPGLKGGGPHYVIDSFSGAITFRRYDQ
jgi:hypothetical protein